MGNKIVIITAQQLEDYQDCTFFTSKEILTIFERYRELDPKRVPRTMTGEEPSTFTIPLEKMEKMAELRENPFRRRICQVFSHDGSGDMTFDDFLDMLSVLSEAAPRDIKIFYAFKIYDYDGDSFIGKADLDCTVRALTHNELEDEEVDVVCDKVLEEADHDDDTIISFTEFQRVISRAPEFLNTFHMRI